MKLTLATLALLLGVSARQDEPDKKTQILLKSVFYTTAEDLWSDVREVDASLRALEVKAAQIVRGMEKASTEEKTKATDALKSLGLAAFSAIKLERDLAGSDELRRDLDRVLKELAGDWPGAVPGEPAGNPKTPAEAEALRIEVAKLAKGLESDSVEDRSKAAGALKSLGAGAIGTIRAERHGTSSELVRRELDAILKELIGPTVALPMGRSLGKTESVDFRAKLGARKIRVVQQPFISVRPGQP